MNSNLPQARALTLAEVKALRNASLDPAFLENDLTMKINAEMVDWILEHAYRGFDFANLPYSACLELATRTYQLTYSVTGTEEKNS
jgi:zona occludens toxin (predicted ATPase)